MAAGKRPDYLTRVEHVVGDVRDPQAVRNALAGIDAVLPLRGGPWASASRVVEDRQLHAPE
jgi:uncharacterized protein YbjT (DUF2867 family)